MIHVIAAAFIWLASQFPKFPDDFPPGATELAEDTAAYVCTLRDHRDGAEFANPHYMPI